MEKTVTTNTPPTSPSLVFTNRTIKTGTEERQFKVLVVDAPSQWPIASSFTSSYTLNRGKASAPIKFKMHGPSLKDYEAMEIANQLPEEPDENAERSPEAIDRFQTLRNQAIDKRNVAKLELVLGATIPGATAEEKSAWIASRNPGEIDALNNFIWEKACGFSNDELLEAYDHMALEAKLDSFEEVEFKSFEDWTAATESRYLFRVCHHKQDYIIEFPLKAIPTEQKRQIEAETKEPDPPMVPARDPKTGRLDPKLRAYNRKEPTYMKAVRAIHQKRTAMFMEASLLFPIRGDNYQQKYDWLSARLVGDVIRLRRFIEEEVIGYAARYSFF